MAILIYATKSTGEKKLIAVAPLTLLDEVQIYCAHRNSESNLAGYHTSYGYERSDAALIYTAEDLT